MNRIISLSLYPFLPIPLLSTLTSDPHDTHESLKLITYFPYYHRIHIHAYAWTSMEILSAESVFVVCLYTIKFCILWNLCAIADFLFSLCWEVTELLKGTMNSQCTKNKLIFYEAQNTQVVWKNGPIHANSYLFNFLKPCWLTFK